MADKVEKNAQRIDDCIAVLRAGKESIGHLAALFAAKAIIDEAIIEHDEWKAGQVATVEEAADQ